MKICVFSSSSNGIHDAYFNEAQKLGELIGIKGHTLVNGAGNVGLMEATSAAAKKNGAHTIGVIPEMMHEKNLTSVNSQEVIITDDMKERKEQIRQISDAFIALPGGFGTLEEILEVITLKQLTYHNKAIVFINTDNFFKHLLNQFDVFFNEKFAKEEYRDLYFIARNAGEAINYIENYQPLEKYSKWFKVPEK
ncbi:MAG: TIGR00730 family Rossman fold protein [Prolixibacteraceae bacterium]|nr:TIGR00730 family Rossman fold protein [Prolixibacteraceae bacterium]MBN2774592.1 TIGR00730 family Rossman fold protein [Prolixibacteraceae bacterium]